MKPQAQPNRWSCVPTSLAIVLDEPISAILAEIGHDGSEVWWPDAPHPYNCRSFHPQELIQCCWKRGFILSQLEYQPASVDEKGTVKPVPLNYDFKSFILDKTGVLLGISSRGNRHAIAWDAGYSVDPSFPRIVEGFNGFKIMYFLMLTSRLDVSGIEHPKKVA